jgi:hypothetical protein
VTYPAIADDHRAGTIARPYVFSFRNGNLTLLAQVSSAAYHGAQKGDKFAVVPSGTPAGPVIPGYFHAFMDDPHEDLFFRGLQENFRSIRDNGTYSDDEYLELITAFVQQIPYDTGAALLPDNPPRFPVETIVEGTGDCDDKSLLLAGLLSREGYDVALLFFVPEHHMAVGVRNASRNYRDTGYLYIETTHPYLVGEVPGTLNLSRNAAGGGEPAGIVILNSTPVVIPTGIGTRQYTSADDTAWILETGTRANARLSALRPGIRDCARQEGACNRTLVDEYNKNAEIHNYILLHRFDRAGTARYLRALEGQKAPPAPAEKGPACPWPGLSWSILGCTRITGPCS